MDLTPNDFKEDFCIECKSAPCVCAITQQIFLQKRREIEQEIQRVADSFGSPVDELANTVERIIRWIVQVLPTPYTMEKARLEFRRALKREWVKELLGRWQRRGLKFRLANGKLLVAPKRLITKKTARRIKRYRKVIVALIIECHGNLASLSDIAAPVSGNGVSPGKEAGVDDVPL